MLKTILVKLDVWITQIRLDISALLCDRRACCQLPPDLIREIARCLLPDVVAYCESEEGKAEFAKWQQEQEKSKV